MFDPMQNIQAYLDNALSPNDKALFEKQLKTNSELKNIVDNKKVYDHISDGLIESLIEENINEVKSQTSNTSRAIKINWMIRIAASFILAIGVFNFLKSDNVDLYDKYYSPPIGSVTRSNLSSEIEQLKQCDAGHWFLEYGDKIKAEKAFNLALNDPETRCRHKAEFYSALILVFNNQIAEAKVELEKLSKIEDHLFKSKINDLLSDLK